MTDYQLGDRVKFTHSLGRRRRYVRPQGPPSSWSGVPPSYDEKTWQPYDAPHGRFGGLVVGRRTLQDGEWHWYGDAGEFKATRRFRAYLVAWHLDKRPVFVLPEHLEAETPPRGTIVVPRPHVPHGPKGIPHGAADADYFRAAARRLGGDLFGSNLSATLREHLESVALALEATDELEVKP